MYRKLVFSAQNLSLACACDFVSTGLDGNVVQSASARASTEINAAEQ